MKNTLLTFALVLGLGSVFLSSCGTDDEMAFRSGSATSNDRIFKTTVW
ncbi:MAG: hypothetical protein QMC68_02825 [Bacteroidia bacterium]